MKRFISRAVFPALAAVMVVGLVSANACGQSVGGAEYEVYRCEHKLAAEVEKPLRALLPEGPDVHLVVDPASNSLLLRGGRDVQRIAKSLLEHVDRPPSDSGATSTGQNSAFVKTYRSPAGRLDEWLGIVRAICADAQDVRITAARESNQVIVLAPPVLQQEISRRLDQETARPRGWSAAESGEEGAMRRLPGSAGEAGNRNAASPAGGMAEVDRMLHLRQIAPEELERRLVALFGRRLRARRGAGRELMVLPVGHQRVIQFRVEAERQLVRVSGPEKIVRQFSQLVDALDAGSRAGQRTKAVHVEKTSDQKLREAVDAYRDQSPRSEQRAEAGGDESAYVHSSGVRLVNYLFQQQGGGAAGADAGAGAGADAGAGGEDPSDSAVVPNVPGLGDLEIQTLPDLDMIIIRGRDQDVEQLTEIIRELERLSAETIPKIHIYHLQHTHNEAMAEIIGQVEQELVGRRQGRVTVTPLGKPNSLLLIGWGDAVDAVVELINKLDRPVPPESQFAVFHLKHAAVATVQQTVTQFLNARPALGPRVQAAVDVRTNSLIVYAAPRDMKEVERLIKEVDVPQSGAVNRARIFRVQNALASDIADTLQQAISASQAGQPGRSAVLELMVVDDEGREILESGMLGEMSITPNLRNNTLIVTGPPGGMGLVEAFIKQLDTPADRAQIKVFQIENADATNLVSVLRSLLPSQVGQPQVATQIPAAPGEESLAPLRFTVEVRSNSIIAVGSEGDLQIVEALITRLDESESMDRKNAVYLLKNAPAVDVADAINEFLQSQRTLTAAEPGQRNPFQDLEREVIVVPEPVSNRLIVSATRRYFDEITQLIEKLDAPPPEVMIRVLIAEVSLGDRDELGVELGLQDSVLFDRSLLGELLTTTNSRQESTESGVVTITEEIIQAATNTPGYEFNSNQIGNSGSDKALGNSKEMGGQALSNFALTRTNEEAGFGGLILAASSRNVSVLIRALQEDRELRILSRPVVRTMDNQPSFIQVGQRVPRIVGTTIGNFGQTNQIDQENVGLILAVTPRISPDGRVVMEVDAEKSKVGPEEEGIPVGTSLEGTVIRSPRVDTITAQATVSVANGETVVLGGMIATEKESIERRVPYLGDVPVLGHLFRYDWGDKSRSEMIIIMTPQIIENPADSEQIKQAELARMSWCAADVYDLYGDIGMDFQPNLSTPRAGADTEVIYPDVDPRGEQTQTPAGSDSRGRAPAQPNGTPRDAPAQSPPTPPALPPPRPSPYGTRQAPGMNRQHAIGRQEAGTAPPYFGNPQSPAGRQTAVPPGPYPASAWTAPQLPARLPTQPTYFNPQG